MRQAICVFGNGSKRGRDRESDDELPLSKKGKDEEEVSEEEESEEGSDCASTSSDTGIKRLSWKLNG